MTSDVKLDKYRIIKSRTLGKGAFSVIYVAEDIGTREQYAVKTEPKKNSRNLLEIERIFIDYINRKPHDDPFVKCYYYGSDNENYYMITDLLGPNLETLKNSQPDKKFSLKTTLILAYEIITRIKLIHNRHFIHRDLKPENILVEHHTPQKKIYIVDFGLIKKYRKCISKEHINFTTQKHRIGTPRYMSINAHLGNEQSRRDDLLSIGYMLVYFVKGRLPWQNINIKEKAARHAKIAELKTNISNEDLCEGLPDCFKKYFDHVTGLEFKERPDYNYLRKLFLEYMKDNDIPFDYCWDWLSKWGAPHTRDR